MTETKVSTLNERVMSLALLALDLFKNSKTPDGFPGMMFAMLKKTTDKDPRFLYNMIKKQLDEIGEEQIRDYLKRARDEIIPYILGEDEQNNHPG